nr:virus-cell attachment protein [Nelson Bay orthoreovirus]WHP37799.1 virus-cell attachment protein [Nelson Bay orthoreovirus]
MDPTSSFTIHHSLSPPQRREVIALIMTMTQSISASRSDLSATRAELAALSTRVNGLTSQITTVSSTLSQLSDQFSSLSLSVTSNTNSLNSLSGNIQSHSAMLSKLSSSLNDISTTLTDTSNSVTRLSSQYATLETDVANSKSSLAIMASQLKSLESTLNDTTQSIPRQVTAPLSISNGSLTLNMNPRFCRSDAGLSSYSSQTLLQTFAANLTSSLPGTNLATTIIVHSHGSTSTFNLTSNHDFTPTGERTQLTLNVRDLRPAPTDWSVLLAQPAFQSSDFLGYAWANISSVWSPITLVGRVTADPKVINLYLGTTPNARVTGLVLTFSIDT